VIISLACLAVFLPGWSRGTLGFHVDGAVRWALQAARMPIGSNDLLIAAHAYATGATIVTDQY
jgi:predicted nucleic acid-binding protein